MDYIYFQFLRETQDSCNEHPKLPDLQEVFIVLILLLKSHLQVVRK